MQTLYGKLCSWEVRLCCLTKHLQWLNICNDTPAWTQLNPDFSWLKRSSTAHCAVTDPLFKKCNILSLRMYFYSLSPLLSPRSCSRRSNSGRGPVMSCRCRFISFRRTGRCCRAGWEAAMHRKVCMRSWSMLQVFKTWTVFTKDLFSKSHVAPVLHEKVK